MKPALARFGCMIALAAASAVALPEELGDIPFTRGADSLGGEYPAAIFPHWVHRMQFRCYVCHEDLFKMKAGADTVKMTDISAGKFCGACHNGKIAFSVVFESCPRCHHQ